MRRSEADALRDLFPGDGEMAGRMRALDWARTELGPPRAWPDSLKTAVSICLTSRFPMLIWWGPQLAILYNDGYIPALGKTKHPQWLGRSGRECWRELWPTVGPMLESVMATGTATWSEDLHLVMDRNVPHEETYFTFSYSPILDAGRVGGVFCAVTETTPRVLGERRLRTLRDLGTRVLDAKTDVHACQVAAETLAENPADIPFSLFYLLDDDRETARLAAAHGIVPGWPGAPPAVPLRGGGPPWPLARATAATGPCLVDVPAAPVGGAGAATVERAALCAVAGTTPGSIAGVIVAGLSPHRVVDADYTSFLTLVARQVAAGVANARAYAEERRRAEALAEIDRAKTAFFSNVSHEFRTPLTLMLVPLEDALADGAEPLGPRNAERLDVAYRNSRRLLKLVNALLDFSRLEAGRMQPVYRQTDLAAYTEELASTFRSAVERAGLSFDVSCEPIRGPVYVDREMWEKVVLNLLSNAFKFTLEGGIAVHVRERDGRALLSVRDTGSGIAAAELPAVFERFHRVRGARARTHEGTGIGLSLVRELVALHGGTVAAESEPGRGSTFTVALPLGRAHLPADRIDAARTLASTAVGATPYVEEALGWLGDAGRGERLAADAGACPAAVATAGARILLADDNRDMRDYLARLLSVHWTVEAVADGEEALAALGRTRPDLVLADVMMPRLDGFGLLARIRADAATRALPVILLSARAGEEARVEGLERGADDYLVKPFSARELVARVNATLELARVRAEALRTQETLARDLQAKTADLEAVLATLRETNRQKDEFLAMLGHELRNPLAAVRNAVATASMDVARRPRALAIARRQTDQLGRLIDDLLDVARITQGRIPLRKERVLLGEVLERALDNVRPVIESRGLVLQVAMGPVPLRVEGDPARLEQVFVNLLGNAAKYTEPGGRITLEAARDGDAAVVRVRDTGVGIAPDMLPRLWDLFTQADRSLDRAQGGLGIGLTIARRLVELHGGRIAAHSEGVGRGAEFVVRLPAVAGPGEAPDRSAVRGGAPARPAHILVVEDNPDAGDSLVMVLELFGHRVHVVRDGVAALEAVRARKPELMLVDIGLPGVDGYEVARQIRRERGLDRVALVALTGYGGEEDRRQALVAGFDDHLVKPVDIDALHDVMRRFQRTRDGAGPR
jgi:signal transduction histidine kinase